MVRKRDTEARAAPANTLYIFTARTHGFSNKVPAEGFHPLPVFRIQFAFDHTVVVIFVGVNFM